MEMEIEIIYQDNDLVVINKPPGVLVHASPYQKEDQETIVSWLRNKFPQVIGVGDEPLFRPGIVHRLDKDTSGLMIAALSQRSFSYLKNLFQIRQIKKIYHAVIVGEVKQGHGRVEKPIGIISGSTKRSVHSSKMAKNAVTEFKRVSLFKKNGETFSLLSVSPLTGRTHQIRVHLAALHHPVVGDKLYGGKKNAGLAPRQMLHCFSLEFVSPSGLSLCLEAPYPEDFQNFLLGSKG